MTTKDNKLVRVAPLLKLIGDWNEFLSGGYTKEDELLIHRHEQTGKPLRDIQCIKHFVRGTDSRATVRGDK